MRTAAWRQRVASVNSLRPPQALLLQPPAPRVPCLRPRRAASCAKCAWPLRCVRCAARCPGVSGAASRSSTTNFRRRAWYAAQTRRPCAARAMSGAFARRTSRALWAAQRFHSQLRAPRAVPRPLAHLCNSRCVGCTRWARTACAFGRLETGGPRNLRPEKSAAHCSTHLRRPANL